MHGRISHPVRRERHADSKSPCRVALNPLTRGLYLGLAAFFFTLAGLGVALPGIPATPFLLLTSFFLLRSWPAANERLLRSRWFGPLLRDWFERGGIRPSVKYWSIVLVTVFVAASIWWTKFSLPVLLTVLLLALIGIFVIVWLPEAQPRREREVPTVVVED